MRIGKSLLISCIISSFLIGFLVGGHVMHPLLIGDDNFILVRCHEPILTGDDERLEILSSYMQIISIPSFNYDPYPPKGHPIQIYYTPNYVFGIATSDNVEKIRQLKFVDHVYYIG